MKQLFIFLCCIALVALGNAQVLSKISEKEKNILLNSNPEVKALVENLAAQKRVPGIKYPNFPAAETGSGRITLENANGKEDLTIIIFKMTDSAKKKMYLSPFSKIILPIRQKYLQKIIQLSIQ